MKTFMRYATARYSQYQRDWAYRIYVTDGLKVIGGLNMRYIDLFAAKETKTAAEIADKIKGKFRG